MKKIILTGGALMAFAAVSYGQNNSATLNQNGEKQTSEQTQTGNSQKSTVTQTGATTNYGNYAVTNQSGTGVANEAIINQIDARSSRAGITQGFGAVSGSTGNTATITQQNNSGAGSQIVVGGSTPTSQGDVENAGGNWADVTQTGRSLNAAVNQNGVAGGNASTGNFADVDQDGLNHTATVNQSAGALGVSANNESTTRQYGLNNIVTTNQNNNSSSNKAYVNQYSADGGDGGTTVSANEATINQSGVSGNSSQTNIATVNQGTASNGDEGNIATTNQLGSGNEIIINQIGDRNQAGNPAATQPGTVIQVGQGNRTFIDQNNNTAAGDGNIANEVQAFGNNNLIDIDQVGSTNVSIVRMQPQANGTGNNNNNVKIDQNGTGNSSTFDLRASNTTFPGDASPNFSVEQRGRNNFARTDVRPLDGSTNTAATGIDNQVNIQQNNGGNVSGNIFRGRIQGNRNGVEVDQNGIANTIGERGTQGLQIIGEANLVDLDQNGTANKINMRINGGAGAAIGDGNKVYITQTGANNQVGTLSTAVNVGNTVDNTSNLGLYVSGDDNFVQITQDGGDEVKATQNGNDELRVTQKGGSTSAPAQSNRVLINQGGTGKQVADIEQNGDGNYVFGLNGSITSPTFATQSGAGTNTAEVLQINGGGSGNILQLNQNGVGNVTNVTQVKP